LIAATYWLKLIPMYGGYGDGRVRLTDLLRWYGGQRNPAVLAQTALAGGDALLWGGALVALLGAATCVACLTLPPTGLAGRSRSLRPAGGPIPAVRESPLSSPR